SLPSSEQTIRGYAGVSLLVLDECSRIPPETFVAALPMLATVSGAIVALSTPAGRVGQFFEWWEHGGDEWEREKVTVFECSRIDPTFIEDQRKTLGSKFSQEYECEFIDAEGSAFMSALIEKCFTSEVKPLWD